MGLSGIPSVETNFKVELKITVCIMWGKYVSSVILYPGFNLKADLRKINVTILWNQGQNKDSIGEQGKKERTQPMLCNWYNINM